MRKTMLGEGVWEEKSRINATNTKNSLSLQNYCPPNFDEEECIFNTFRVCRTIEK